MKKNISTDLTPENIARVLELLANTPADLERLSQPLDAAQLRIPLGEGERSFHQDLVHLLNVEARSFEVICLAFFAPDPLLAPVHAERDFGKLVRFDRLEFGELLTYFHLRRKVLLGVLTDLQPADWARHIREPGKQRQESIYWRMRGAALHELEHLTDLQRKLKEVFSP